MSAIHCKQIADISDIRLYLGKRVRVAIPIGHWTVDTVDTDIWFKNSLNCKRLRPSPEVTFRMPSLALAWLRPELLFALLPGLLRKAVRCRSPGQTASGTSLRPESGCRERSGKEKSKTSLITKTGHGKKALKKRKTVSTGFEQFLNWFWTGFKLI